MTNLVEYRGYRIMIRQAAEMWANVIGPDGLALAVIPKATIAEGRGILVARAESLIDADIAKTAAAIAKKPTG